MRGTILLSLGCLAILGLQRPALADGNVAAFVDASGDLWLIGDEESNSLHIRGDTGVDGELVITDDSGTTTVNGTASVTLLAPGSRILADLAGGDDQLSFGGSGHACCQRAVLFRGGEGDDRFRLEDEGALLGDLQLELGAGDDAFEAGEGSALGALVLTGGDGDDRVRIGPYVSLFGGARIDLGAGADELDARRLSVHGALTLAGGPGADGLRLAELDVAGAVEVTGDDGDDRLELGAVRSLAGVALDVLGPLFVDAGEGDDQLLLRDACELAPGVVVHAGNGHDSVAFEGARVEGCCRVQLGTGDDRLRVDGSILGLATGVRANSGGASGALLFDGGAGDDLYLAGAGNAFPSGLPVLRGFDAPRLGEAPRLEFPTRIVGRVLCFREPVPDATVSLPDLGLTISTDPDGSFRLDSPATPPGLLELTAGATLDGRHLCGSKRFRAAFASVIDVGELALSRDCANVLVFGDGQDDAAVLEQNLRAVGVAPAALVREAFLPEDLSTFAAAWHVALDAPLTAAEQQRLVAFVRAGGGLHLAGEGTALEAAHEALVNGLVLGGGVRVGVPQGGDAWSPLAYAPDAVGGLGRLPHPLSLVMDFITGGKALGGVAHPNVFIEGASAQVFAAVWSGPALLGGRGRLSLGLSTLWFRSSANLPALENLHAFLARALGSARER